MAGLHPPKCSAWAHEYMAIFVKIDRHRTSGRFKRAGGMLFLFWSVYQRDDGSCCGQF